MAYEDFPIPIDGCPFAGVSCTPAHPCNIHRDMQDGVLTNLIAKLKSAKGGFTMVITK